MRMPTYDTLTDMQGKIEEAEAVRSGLLEGYLRRLMIDHSVPACCIVVGTGSAMEEIRVDGVLAARIELRFEGYVGSWWHGWFYRPVYSGWIS